MKDVASGNDFAEQAGAWTGAHALPLFLLVLVLALVLTLVATALIGLRVRRTAAFSPRQRFFFATAVVGAGSVLFLTLALQLHAGSALTRFDLAVSGAVLQQASMTVVGFFAVLTHAGDTTTGIGLTVVVAALLLWRRHRLLAFGFVGGMAGNAALTSGLKHLWGRARPLQPDGGALAHGYSFPSGHSAGSLVACGLLAYLALRLLPPRWYPAALCAAVALFLSLGASRIFIRAHFPSDVLAGFASGSVWLAAWLLLLETLRWRLESSSRMGRMAR